MDNSNVTKLHPKDKNSSKESFFGNISIPERNCL